MPGNAEPPVIWFSGRPGAGKTTLAEALASRLQERGTAVARLDGDDLRRGLCEDLGYDAASRAENLRRAAYVARLMSDAGLVVVCAFVTPFRRDQAHVREILGARLLDAYVDTSLAECERRDPKGLYRRARAGELPDFTGVSSPFEPPEDASLVLDAERLPVEALVGAVLERLSL